jgi:hypothetical protein
MVVTYPSTSLHLRCVRCGVSSTVYRFVRNFIIAARIGNLSLLLHLVIAADITDHGNYLNAIRHTQRPSVPETRSLL